MKILSLEFSVIMHTSHGDHVVICGNVPQLGSWNPCQGVPLHTNDKMYPKWNFTRFVNVKLGTNLEFKACVLNKDRNLVRWEQTPHNQNRRLIANTHMAVLLQQAIDPTLRAGVCRKTKDILNDLGSGSSSSRQFWRDYMEVDDQEDNFCHYQLFIRAMQTCLESQIQGQIQLFPNSFELSFKASSPFGLAYKFERQNVYLVLEDEHDSDQTNETLSIGSTKQDVTEGSSSQSINKLGNSKEKINARNQYFSSIVKKWLIKIQKGNILVLHLYVKSESMISVAKYLLGLNEFWEIVVHLPKSIIKEYWTFIEAGANMIVLEEEDCLKEVLSDLNSRGLTTNMVQPLLLLLSSHKYRQTLIHCSKSSHQKTILQIANKDENPEGQNLKKINQCLSAVSAFLPQNSLVTQIVLRNPSIFDEIKDGKVAIVINCEKLKSVSLKVRNFLINISGKHNHEVYILHKGSQHGVEKMIPSTSKDKILVINSAGDMYGSRQRCSRVLDSLKINMAKIEQMYDQIIKGIADDNHCSLKRTENNTLSVSFTPDQLGKHVREFIIKLVQKMNSCSSVKLTIIPSSQPNMIQIRPYCTSNAFYIKTIIKNLQSRDTLGKNLLLSIDYSASQRLLNFIEQSLKRQEKSYVLVDQFQKVMHYGFYCRNEDQLKTGYSRPTLTEHSLVNILQKIVEKSQSSQKNDNQTRKQDPINFVMTPQIHRSAMRRNNTLGHQDQHRMENSYQ